MRTSYVASNESMIGLIIIGYKIEPYTWRAYVNCRLRAYLILLNSKTCHIYISIIKIKVELDNLLDYV